MRVPRLFKHAYKEMFYGRLLLNVLLWPGPLAVPPCSGCRLDHVLPGLLFLHLRPAPQSRVPSLSSGALLPSPLPLRGGGGCTVHCTEYSFCLNFLPQARHVAATPLAIFRASLSLFLPSLFVLLISVYAGGRSSVPAPVSRRPLCQLGFTFCMGPFHCFFSHGRLLAMNYKAGSPPPL